MTQRDRYEHVRDFTRAGQVWCRWRVVFSGHVWSFVQRADWTCPHTDKP